MSENLFDSSIYAENNLLSILIKHPEKYFEISFLKPEMLSSVPNRDIFRAIIDYHRSDTTPTYDLLKSYPYYFSKDRGQIDPKEQIDYLWGMNADPNSFPAYENIVVNGFKARTLITITSDIYNKVTSTPKIDELIAGFRNELDRLSENLGSESVVPMSSIVPKILDEIKYRAEHKGVIRGITTGYKQLDAFTSGVNRSNLWIICGRPGQGKTASVCNLIVNQARAGYKPLVFSLEMSKQELGERLVAIESGVSLFVGIRSGILLEHEMERIIKSLDTIKEYPIYLDTKFTPSIDYIENTIRKYKRQYDVDIVYIDYIQILAERDSNSTHELGKFSRRLKLLAVELDIAIVIVSQLNRLVEIRDDKHPILSDLRQSGNLEEDADVVIGLYREKYYVKNSKSDEIEHIIMKQRNGPTGTLMLIFNEETNRISDIMSGIPLYLSKDKHEQTKNQGKQLGKRVSEPAQQEVAEG